MGRRRKHKSSNEQYKEGRKKLNRLCCVFFCLRGKKKVCCHVERKTKRKEVVVERLRDVRVKASLFLFDNFRTPVKKRLCGPRERRSRNRTKREREREGKAIIEIEFEVGG